MVFDLVSVGLLSLSLGRRVFVVKFRRFLDTLHELGFQGLRPLGAGYPVGIARLVQKAPPPRHPVILFGPAKLNGKLADVMMKPLDVGGDAGGVNDLGWPPPVAAKFNPQDFAVKGHSACLTVIAMI